MGKIYTIIFSFLLFIIFPFLTQAASLNFFPVSGSHGVGSTFSVSVNVESADQAMNAASGIVSFPWDKLEVVSVSKQGSIFSLWPAEPSFSNSQGTVSFEGIVLNPGYTGTNGKILTIIFRARNTGQANLSFSSGSVLANDGTGTNILDNLQVAVFTLKSAEKISPPPSSQSETPSSTTTSDALKITSSTHPDKTKWYVNNTPEFSWELPPGTLEIRTLIGKSSTSNPSVSYIPPISKKKVDELPDGTYYFSLKVRTSAGWSAVSRYPVNIDTTPPKPFSIAFPHGNKGWEPQPVIFFNTTDSESGISHYEIKIGSNAKLIKTAPDAVSNPYVLPPQTPGVYMLYVSAIDNAGNIRNSSDEFTIESIDAPVITFYPETIESGDILKIIGTTYPNSDVTIFIREGTTLLSEEYIQSNSTGDFTFVITKKLNSGVYTFTVRVKDNREAQSNETSPLTIFVRSEFVSDIVSFVLKYLSVALLAILSLGVIILSGVYLWFRISRIVLRMRREAREAEKVSEHAFKVLRQGVAKHLSLIKKVKSKRKLTEEEIAFLEEFDEKLEEAEEVIQKEIQDISH